MRKEYFRKYYLRRKKDKKWLEKSKEKSRIFMRKYRERKTNNDHKKSVDHSG